jgi:hypothetical protein
VHLGIAWAVVFLGLIPIVAVALAWRGTRSRRLLFALVAFIVLETRFLLLLAIHTVFVVDHFTEEMVTFGGDLAVITAFSLAFLHGARWGLAKPDREPA